MKLVQNLSLKIFLMMFSVILVFGCSQSNKITDSWVNPDATKESIKFNKVAVFGLVMKTANRKLVEEELARRLVNTIAVPSYKVVSDDDISKPDVIKAKLSEQGFDGALILRLVDIPVIIIHLADIMDTLTVICIIILRTMAVPICQIKL